MVCGHVSAQEAVIDFSGSTDNWGIGTTKIVEAKEFTYNGLTIKLEGTEGNGYRWYDTGNILMGKQGATLTLPAFNFDVERIDVVGTSGASANVTQNIFVGDEAVSTETTGAKDVTNEYKIAADKQAAGTIYVLKVTSNHNTQITKILIWKKGTTGDNPEPEIAEINVAKALEIINGLADGATTTDAYKVKGFVVGTPDFQRKADGSLYGNVNLDIADEKGGSSKLTVFRAKSYDNQAFTEETISLISENDEVVFQGKLQKYVKNEVVTPELSSGWLISVNSGQQEGGVIFSANPTEAWDAPAGAETEIPAANATIAGGKMYANNGQNDAKAMIKVQGGEAAFQCTNNNTFFKVVLDKALEAGDVISTRMQTRTDTDLGLFFAAEATRPSETTTAIIVPTADGQVWTDAPTYTVAAGDGICGQTTFYIFRATGKSTYFNAFKITRDGTTGISNVQTIQIDNEAVYNLSGQKVDASYKGVVIKGGKKFFQK